MSTNDATRGPQVCLNYPTQDKLLIAFAKGVLVALTGNASFPSPNPTLATFEADIDAYDAAETMVGTKAKGTVEQRNAKRQKVIADLKHVRDYVQGVIETVASPGDATAMITSAGMHVRKVGKRNKAALSARNAGTSGTVQLDAKAVAPTATYLWQHSVDQQTWLDIPMTMQASTVVTGLTPAQRYYFQFRALTRSGTSDLSQVVSLIVQ